MQFASVWGNFFLDRRASQQSGVGCHKLFFQGWRPVHRLRRGRTAGRLHEGRFSHGGAQRQRVRRENRACRRGAPLGTTRSARCTVRRHVPLGWRRGRVTLPSRIIVTPCGDGSVTSPRGRPFESTGVLSCAPGVGDARVSRVAELLEHARHSIVIGFTGTPIARHVQDGERLLSIFQPDQNVGCVSVVGGSLAAYLPTVAPAGISDGILIRKPRRPPVIM